MELAPLLTGSVRATDCCERSGNPITSPPDYAAAFTNSFLPPCP